ncbi:MAG: hypothetical protein ACI8SA_001804 [Dokdonia sp.]|jgi:hypothetical protein
MYLNEGLVARRIDSDFEQYFFVQIKLFKETL